MPSPASLLEPNRMTMVFGRIVASTQKSKPRAGSVFDKDRALKLKTLHRCAAERHSLLTKLS